MKKAMKLQLIKQTIRLLQNSELEQARGGLPNVQPDGPALGSSVCRVGE
jgi:hypothetical protein